MTTTNDDHVRTELTDEDRRRIAERYPAQPALHRLLVVTAVVLGILGTVWTVWAGLHHARPDVEADVHGFTVVSDTQIDVDVRVQRRDPGKVAICTVRAQSPDYVRVGELEARIEPATEQVSRQVIHIKTIAKATTATVEGCRLA